MELVDARAKAEYLLELLIKHQPNLFVPGGKATDGTTGKAVAEFSYDFIDTYTTYLTNRT
ncbi:hypothetical protein H8L32_21710 [Undibacterium sp. CY18W]|uniref:Uncharacterized protein n=1 Tax=Undibacterium hunanense TaxID=2762292 RepID=A0ABR6ZWT1_9BURK|nr:hypothetical protein [Undibacterium hunanense]MBC3920099.1 hypothetical protein [Undibacterium hunanense]